MTKTLEQLSNDQVKSLEENKKIEYLVSATLSGPEWVHTPKDYFNTVLHATDPEILQKAEYFEVTGYENGVKVVPYEQARGGAMNIHSLYVNFFRNTKQESTGESK